MSNISSIQSASSTVGAVARTAPVKPVTAAPNPNANASSTPTTAPNPVNPSTATVKPSDNELQQAVDQANQVLEVKTSNELQFSVDKSTGISVVKMINQKSGETILQFPSEAMLKIAKSIDQSTGGIIRKQA